MRDSKIVFCDTSFFIRFLNEEDSLHSNAKGYFQYFLEHEYKLYISTIAIAEFCVKGNIEELPLREIRVSPFNIEHAILAGACVKTLYEARRVGAIEVNHRIIIANDVKLMAQAQCEGAGYYITSDKECKKMYDILAADKRIDFDFIDLNTPYTAKFGLLDFDE